MIKFKLSSLNIKLHLKLEYSSSIAALNGNLTNTGAICIWDKLLWLLVVCNDRFLFDKLLVKSILNTCFVIGLNIT